MDCLMISELIKQMYNILGRNKACFIEMPLLVSNSIVAEFIHTKQYILHLLPLLLSLRQRPIFILNHYNTL